MQNAINIKERVVSFLLIHGCLVNWVCFICTLLSWWR